MKAALLIMTMLLTGCATVPHTAQQRKWLKLAVSAQIADTVSTAIALNQGLEEGNPAFGNDPGMETIIVGKAAVLGVVYVVGCFLPDSRTTIYKWTTGLGYTAATWNGHQIIVEGA